MVEKMADYLVGLMVYLMAVMLADCLVAQTVVCWVGQMAGNWVGLMVDSLAASTVKHSVAEMVPRWV